MVIAYVNIYIISYYLNIYTGYLTISIKIITYWGAYNRKSDMHGNSYSHLRSLKSVPALAILTNNAVGHKIVW